MIPADWTDRMLWKAFKTGNRIISLFQNLEPYADPVLWPFFLMLLGASMPLRVCMVLYELVRKVLS